MTKKLLAAILSSMICASLAACGGNNNPAPTGNNGISNSTKESSADSADDSADNESKQEEKPDREVRTFQIHEDGSAPLAEMSTISDPQAIFDSIEYTEKMLYGFYTIGGEVDFYPSMEEGQAFVSGKTFESTTYEGAQTELTKIPCMMLAGPQNHDNILSTVKEYEWMTLYFSDKDVRARGKVAAYTVEGNVLSVRYLEDYSYDPETDHFSFTLSETPVEYTFSFDGIYLTLSRDGESVTMHPGDIGTSEHSIMVNAYPENENAVLDNINGLSFQANHTANSNTVSAYVEAGGQFHYGTAVEMRDDGVITFSWDDENGSAAYQMVYFYCASDGLVLTDGQNIYYYTGSEYQTYVNALGSNLSAEDTMELKEMDTETLDELMKKRASLFEKLAAAYKEAGMNVTVNADTGEIALDAAVLFGVDQYDISDGGKAFLNQFLEIYTSVVFAEEYDGFVSQIIVEGHTDSSGSYDHNQELSQNRAESVMTYCLSPDTGLNSASTANLQSLLSAVGYSCDRLIYDAQGNEDMDASRRVSFRFIINLG